MDFVLGLVLSLTDNASAGLNNAVQSLSNLTSVAERACGSLDNLDSTASLLATSQSANMIGSSFIRAGSGMLGMFNTLIAKTQQLGSEYEDFGITLSSLGMDSNNAINKLFDFSNRSPLEVGDVKDMIVTLQSQGVNAFDKTTGAITGTRQEFLAFLTDLKSFKPELDNERFKMALQNYIGSGEKKMIRTAFDMGDIEDIIGHKVSDTAEGRMQDIVEMVENKGLTGLSEKLASTWSGVASNIDDAFTRIFYSVANDGGVFKKLKESFLELADIIIKLPDEELASLGRTIGSALDTIISPLTKVVKGASKLAKSMISLSKTHPAILKWGIVLSTVSGIGLVLTGVVFKLIGSLASFVLVMQSLGGTINSVSQVFKIGFSRMASSLGPFIKGIGLLAVAWATDFGGIRTMTLNFVNNVSSAFNTAKTNVDGSVQGLHEALKTLRGRDDFWSNITIGLMKIYGTFKFVAEAWNNNTLSEESFQKAEALGILPLIENILDLKYRFEHFVEGFKEGWNAIGDKVQSVISKIKGYIEGTFLEGAVDKITQFTEALTNNDPESWRQFGIIMSGIVASLITAIALVKGFKLFFKLFINIGYSICNLSIKVYNGTNRLFSILGKVFNLLSKVGSSIVKVFTPIGNAIVKVFTPIKNAVVSLFTSIGRFVMNNPITLIITGAITAVTSFISMFKKGFNIIKSIIMSVGIALVAVGAVLLGAVPALGAAIVAGIVAIVANLVIIIKDNWNSIRDFVSNVCINIKNKVVSIWTSIKSTVVGIVVGLYNAISTRFNSIRDKISSVLGTIKTNVSNAWNNIKNSFVNAGNTIKSKVSEIFNGVKTKISESIDGIKAKVSNGLSTIKNLFSNLKLSLPHIKTPHFNISGGKAPFGIGGKGSIPKIGVDWYARGGVFDSPNIIGVGEQGKEAVMPLENNTGWIGTLASDIASRMPTSVNTNSSVTNNNPITKSINNNTNNTTSNTSNSNSNVDNSVHFEAGSIVIQAKEISSAEAEKFARMVMEKIKRIKELDNMLAYQS